MDLTSQLCMRLGQLKAARSKHESHWKQCYQFGAPERQQDFSGSGIENERETQRAVMRDEIISLKF